MKYQTKEGKQQKQEANTFARDEREHLLLE